MTSSISACAALHKTKTKTASSRTTPLTIRRYISRVIQVVGATGQPAAGSFCSSTLKKKLFAKPDRVTFPSREAERYNPAILPGGGRHSTPRPEADRGLRRQRSGQLCATDRGYALNDAGLLGRTIPWFGNNRAAAPVTKNPAPRWVRAGQMAGNDQSISFSAVSDSAPGFHVVDRPGSPGVSRLPHQTRSHAWLIRLLRTKFYRRSQGFHHGAARHLCAQALCRPSRASDFGVTRPRWPHYAECYKSGWT